MEQTVRTVGQTVVKTEQAGRNVAVRTEHPVRTIGRFVEEETC